jgi:exodeoxyribonuclease VII large subunit
MPNVPVVLYPTPVQGEGAGQKIAAAIRCASERADCDVLIVCRGGGSIEDLWAFNEEVVARAIADSHIPVVSGVGHETDFTITDFVADLRAATPTAAAQAVVPDGLELRQRLMQLQKRFSRAANRRFEQAMQQLDFTQRRLVHPAQRIQLQSERLLMLKQRCQGAMSRSLAQRMVRLASMKQHLQHLDPSQVLARGYSLVRDANGHIVFSSQQVKEGAALDITFAQGEAGVVVREKR